MKKVFIFAIAPSFLVLSSLISCNKNQVVKIRANCNDTFFVDDPIYKTNIKVIADYSNNTSKYVYDWNCDLFSNNDSYIFSQADAVEGYKDFTIKYSSKVTTLKISVIEKTKEISFKDVDVFNSNSGEPNKIGSIQLAFLTSQNDIPYVNVNSYLSTFLNGYYNFETLDNKYKFTNKLWSANTYKPCAYFDYSTNTFSYDDYTCFICTDDYASNPLELSNSKGRSYFKVEEQGYTAGDELIIDLDNYSITTYSKNNNLFMPLYTAKCLLTVNMTSYFYNGKALYIDAKQANTNFNAEVRNNLFTPSSNYLEYAFNQFALDIDLHFGMRNFSRKLRSQGNTDYKYMGGTGGDAYSVLSPLKSNFISSASSFDQATNDFYKTYLDDGGHTGLLSRSYYKPVATTIDYGDEIKRSSTIGSRINSARAAYEITPGTYYIKNSDTDYTRLFIFNQFGINEANAFVNLVNEINNDSGKTKHIIIDLSNNGGGYVFFSEMLVNWLTKGKASSHILSSINGSKGYTKYSTDNNFDNAFDSNDYLPNTVETIDIITSGKSFSAANYTACQVAKYGDDEYTKVYIDGENSGGGVCAVEGSMMNCIGMTAQWSSLYRLCEQKNDGSWVGVDDGVTSMTKTDGTQVTINGESWNSLDNTQVLKYADYIDLNTKILAR